MTEKVELGLTGNGEELNCVFVSILAKNVQPYASYSEPKNLRAKELTVPMVLAQMRWDGSIGFPGGKVDESDKINGCLTRESLINALCREMNEEINIPLDSIDKNNFKELCTFKDTKEDTGEAIYIHNFIYEVEKENLIPIIKNALNSPHIISENCGNILLHLINYSETKGINNLLNHKYSGSAKEELIELIDYLNKK